MIINADEIINELRENVKKANPNFSDEEVSAYVAGMIAGFALARR